MKKLFCFLMLGSLIVAPATFVGCGPAGRLDSDEAPIDVPDEEADEGEDANAQEGE